MSAYIIRRILYMIPIVFGVATLTFILFTIFGEDPVRIALGNHASEDAIAALEKEWGLDKPYIIQYFDFLWQVITFDYGRSFSTGETFWQLFSSGVLVSLSLTAPPFLLGTLINIGVAIVISYYRDTWFDRFSRVIFVISMSISYLVYIIVLQYMLAYQFNFFPIQGYEPGLSAISYLALPWIIMMIASMGSDIRIFRTIFLDQVKADYIRTARAKGASKNRVLFVHLLKNAMIPILTNTVIAVPFLITGAFVMERYFSIPGVGDMTITAINEGDFPIIKAMTIMLAITYALFNLITDLLYAFVDPRVNLS